MHIENKLLKFKVGKKEKITLNENFFILQVAYPYFQFQMNLILSVLPEAFDNLPLKCLFE